MDDQLFRSERATEEALFALPLFETICLKGFALRTLVMCVPLPAVLPDPGLLPFLRRVLGLPQRDFVAGPPPGSPICETR